jgi:hypothetical protein
MEIFGGFMVMMSIISIFLAVVWLFMPFVVFAIKGKQDRTLEVLEAIEKRLATLEERIPPLSADSIRTECPSPAPFTPQSHEPAAGSQNIVPAVSPLSSV